MSIGRVLTVDGARWHLRDSCVPEPWFTKSWKGSPGGTRSVVAACGNLVAGTGGIALAMFSDGTVPRVLWSFFGVVFLSLGGTLLATLHRRRVRT